MIVLKTRRELDLMREACRISANALREAGKAVEPGVSTQEIDDVVRNYIRKQGASPSFLGYGGFPASACISVNNVVIHGIPSKKQILKSGDIVSVDVGAFIGGFHGDNAYTYACGDISKEARALLDATKESLYEGIKQAKAGNHLYDISNAIADYIEPHGYGIVRELVGHGIGTHLHEDPQIPNFRQNKRGPKLYPGMTLAIEPMINLGRADVEWLDDDWTVVAEDGLPSAHYENTILITDGEPEILTLL